MVGLLSQIPKSAILLCLMVLTPLESCVIMLRLCSIRRHNTPIFDRASRSTRSGLDPRQASVFVRTLFTCKRLRVHFLKVHPGQNCVDLEPLQQFARYQQKYLVWRHISLCTLRMRHVIQLLFDASVDNNGISMRPDAIKGYCVAIQSCRRLL